MYGLYTYMKGEKLPHEQVEMAGCSYSRPIRRIWGWSGAKSLIIYDRFFQPWDQPSTTDWRFSHGTVHGIWLPTIFDPIKIFTIQGDKYTIYPGDFEDSGVMNSSFSRKITSSLATLIAPPISQGEPSHLDLPVWRQSLAALQQSHCWVRSNEWPGRIDKKSRICWD